MPTEVKLVDLALNLSLMLALGVHSHTAALTRFEDFSAGSRFVRVAYKENGVLRRLQDVSREPVRDGVFGHHAAGKGVDTTGVEVGFAMAARKDLEVLKVFEYPKTAMEAMGGFAEQVCDLSHAGAKAPDMDRDDRDDILRTKLMQHHK